MQLHKLLIILIAFSVFAISIKSYNFNNPKYQYFQYDCPNTTTFTSNSTYQSNRNILLSSLLSNSTGGNGFFNASAGKDSDTVYGLFLCRGDVPTGVCRDCIAHATEDIVQRCPVEKVAIIWYDYCLLRYSDRIIISAMTIEPVRTVTHIDDVNEPARFNRLMVTAMREAASQAAAAPSGHKKAAAREVNFTAFETLYNFVQCTPDLSGFDCSQCLEYIIQVLPRGWRGGRSLSPSCNARYDLYEFYSATALPSAPPPPLVLPPPPPKPEGKGGVSAIIIVAIVAPIAVAVVFLFMGYRFLRRRAVRTQNTFLEDDVGNEITTVESLQFDFATIEAATQKFSNANRLGEGGFGVVYKGTLPNGKEIAVKRLSRSSGQGIEQLKNEVVLVAKLQHRHLVRLLGFCLEEGEKILIYEFVPNRSLDYFIFDLEKQALLHWPRRYKIIEGIARGILYLHEDSQLRIIHRDLKASNILLDGDMNPKISDFGMARIFGVDQIQGSTNKIVGTYGYMSPEYAMHGHFSVKSDVYSFGILVLEIVCGKKNSSFYESNVAEDLTSYVWKHWRDGRPMEVLDANMAHAYSKNQVIRCIHIGLLCVQEDPADRPSMKTIVLMLDSYSVSLPSPKQPAFFMHNKIGEHSLQVKELDSDKSISKSVPDSVNEISITEMYPR